MFDRQIDLIMKDFAPVAQRYLKHVAKVNGLEKDDLCRLEVDLDSALNPQVTIDDAYDLVLEVGRTFGERILSRKLLAIKKSAGWTLLPIVARILAVMRRIHIACTLCPHELDRSFE